MLLLLRTPPSGATAATLALSLGLVASGSASTANLSTALGLTLSSVEMRVNADVGFANKLIGISSGFLSGPATALTTVFDLPASGGFGFTTQLTTVFGLTGTVGTTLQGIASPTITWGLTTNPLIVTTANPGIAFTLAGTPITSGGLLTPTAIVPITFALNANPALAAAANCNITFGLPNTPALSIPNLATEMRLSFSADEMHLFFRKG